MPLFKTSLCAKLSYENELHLRESEPVMGTRFHINGIHFDVEPKGQLRSGLFITTDVTPEVEVYLFQGMIRNEFRRE